VFLGAVHESPWRKQQRILDPDWKSRFSCSEEFLSIAMETLTAGGAERDQVFEAVVFAHAARLNMMNL
jgi:hypothetical protein